MNVTPSPSGQSRVWACKKQSIVADLRAAEAHSPVLDVLQLTVRPDEIRAVLGFGVPTLVAPERDEVRLEGPVIVGVRYNETFVTRPPVPWELVSILLPQKTFHANLHPSGGLCIGSPPAGISMESILHLTWAAITLQSYNTIEWQGLNKSAADFIRRHASAFPIVGTGLNEIPSPSLRRPVDRSLRFPLPTLELEAETDGTGH